MSRSVSSSTVRHLLFVWGLVGVCLLLGRALHRLIPIALEPIDTLTPIQAVIYVGWALLNTYTEGYRGFQKRFVPRVLGRIVYLSNHPTIVRVVFAPFFVMGYFQAKTRAMISAWLVSFLVFLAVVAIRFVPQPWRGVIDAGVVTGLGYGGGALLYFAIRLVRGTYAPPDPDMPDSYRDASSSGPVNGLNSAA